MSTVKAFDTAFGTVLFLHQGVRTFGQTPCHCYQVAVQGLDGSIRYTHQAIPTQAERDPQFEDALAIALMLARRANRP